MLDRGQHFHKVGHRAARGSAGVPTREVRAGASPALRDLAFRPERRARRSAGIEDQAPEMDQYRGD